jgi:hypothetical protein
MILPWKKNREDTLFVVCAHLCLPTLSDFLLEPPAVCRLIVGLTTLEMTTMFRRPYYKYDTAHYIHIRN